MRAVRTLEDAIFCSLGPLGLTSHSVVRERARERERDKVKQKRDLRLPADFGASNFPQFAPAFSFSLPHNKIQASVLFFSLVSRVALLALFSPYYAYNHVNHFQGNDQTNPSRPCTLTLAPECREMEGARAQLLDLSFLR